MVLQKLASRGYKGSASKAQILTQRVQFLGLTVTPGTKNLPVRRKSLILDMRTPATKQ